MEIIIKKNLPQYGVVTICTCQNVIVSAEKLYILT